jgi:hypothetical protein
MAIDTKNQALPSFIATTLLFEGAYTTVFDSGMVVMISKAFVHFDAMIEAFSLLTRFRGQFG